MSGEFAYSGMALQDIKDGKIAAMQVERANFTVNTQQAGKADKMTGEIANLASRDFDAAALPPSSIRRRPTTTTITALRQDDGRSLYHHVSARPAHAHRRR